jgi:hypothetical protein
MWPSVDEIRISPRMSIRRSVEDDIVEIAPRMRQQDIDELWASGRHTPVEALVSALISSDYTFTVVIDGRAECMFGLSIISHVTGHGSPWFLGTDEIQKHRRDFLRASVQWRDMFVARTPDLRNCVDDRNELSKRWLRWLGFELTEPVPMGYDGAMFRMFSYKGA